MSRLVRLRVMTFNIHGGRPAAGPVNLTATADVIRGLEPTLAGLQEVHCYLPPPYVFQDQPSQLRNLLGMELHFGRTLGLGPVGYGNAILSRLPAAQIQAGTLPRTRERKGIEPRGVMEAWVVVDGCTVRFLNTHLGLTPDQRRLQVGYLAERVRRSCEPVILAGDLNAVPGSAELQLLAEAGLQDCALPDQLTFPADLPTCRIDHLFVSRQFEVERCFSEPTQVSDHRPLVADLLLRG